MGILLDNLPANLVHRSLLLGVVHVLLTAVLELTCWREVRKLRSTPSGKALHNSGWYKTLFNDLILESITYYGTIRFLCHPDTASLVDQLVAAAGIVVIEAVLYYWLHKAYHEVKSLWWIHRYHHRFNTIILPSTAMAVSVTEFATAYMFPVVIGVAVTHADETASFLCGLAIGFFNLLIHTPWMEAHDYPLWILVSASDHMSHHRKNRDNYGAPILHMDRILASVGLGKSVTTSKVE